MSSGDNAFLHYLEVGRAEGRAGRKPGAGWTDATVGFIRSSGAFACDHYRTQAGEAAASLDEAGLIRLAATAEPVASAAGIAAPGRLGSAGGASGARQITIVIGMHRSGTSLAAHALHRLGIGMSEDNRISSDNRKGHWERPAIVAFHDRILQVFDRGWFDPRHSLALPAEWWLHPEVRAIRSDMAAWLKQRLPGCGHVGFKDPRTARLLPFWHGLCEELTLEPCYVFCVREPGQVARSLRIHDGLSPQEAVYRWMVHNSHAALGLEGRPICIIPYEAWFTDGRAVLDRLASHRCQAAALPDFIIDRLEAGLADPLLRHDQACAVTGRLAAAHALYQSILDSAPVGKLNAAARAQADAFIGFEALIEPFLTPSCGATGAGPSYEWASGFGRGQV
jgi:hypothetical protein